MTDLIAFSGKDPVCTPQSDLSDVSDSKVPVTNDYESRLSEYNIAGPSTPFFPNVEQIPAQIKDFTIVAIFTILVKTVLKTRAKGSVVINKPRLGILKLSAAFLRLDLLVLKK